MTRILCILWVALVLNGCHLCRRPTPVECPQCPSCPPVERRGG